MPATRSDYRICMRKECAEANVVSREAGYTEMTRIGSVAREAPHYYNRDQSVVLPSEPAWLFEATGRQICRCSQRT